MQSWKTESSGVFMKLERWDNFVSWYRGTVKQGVAWTLHLRLTHGCLRKLRRLDLAHFALMNRNKPSTTTFVFFWWIYTSTCTACSWRLLPPSSAAILRCWNEIWVSLALLFASFWDVLCVLFSLALEKRFSYDCHTLQLCSVMDSCVCSSWHGNQYFFPVNNK